MDEPYKQYTADSEDDDGVYGSDDDDRPSPASIAWCPAGLHLVQAAVSHPGSAPCTRVSISAGGSLVGTFTLALGPEERVVSIHATHGAKTLCVLTSQEPQGHRAAGASCTMQAAFCTMLGALTACHALPWARHWDFHPGRAILVALRADGRAVHICGPLGSRSCCVALPTPPRSCAIGLGLSPDGRSAVVWRCGFARSELIFVSLAEEPAVVCCKKYNAQTFRLEEVFMEADVALGRHSVLLAVPCARHQEQRDLLLLDARTGAQGRLLCQLKATAPVQADPSGRFFAASSADRTAVQVLHGLSGAVVASINVSEKLYTSAHGSAVFRGDYIRFDVCGVQWHCDGRGLSCSCHQDDSFIGTSVFTTMRFAALGALAIGCHYWPQDQARVLLS